MWMGPPTGRLLQLIKSHIYIFFDWYSHHFNKRGGWNKCGGGAKVAKLINVEVGITVEAGFFMKNQ